MRSMSEVMRSGGFSSAAAYIEELAVGGVERLAPKPLYSQPKQPLRQTSAQPSPPVALEAPFSKVNHSCRSGRR